MGKRTVMPKQEIFCGNPMCEYHCVPMVTKILIKLNRSCKNVEHFADRLMYI